MKLAMYSLCAMLTLVLVAGCSEERIDYSSVDLINASGKVTLDGAPLAGAVITFETADGLMSYGMTNDSGTYTLQFDSVKNGVTPGKKTVRISTTRKILGLNAAEGEGGQEGGEDEGSESQPQAKAVEKVPAKYNSTSELTVDVTAGQTTYDFDLKST